MIFNITDQERKDNCKKFIGSLPEGDKWEVVIQERTKQRSKAQNRLYHMWKPYVAKHCGYTLAQMHDEFKYTFIGKETYTTRKGEVRSRPLSTTTLTVKEFAEFLNEIEQAACSLEIKLPIPDDYLFCMMRE